MLVILCIVMVRDIKLCTNKGFDQFYINPVFVVLRFNYRWV